MSQGKGAVSVSITPQQVIYKFGTSGYRSDQEEGFNESVVRQITGAICDYLISEMEREGVAKPVLIGGDTREKTRQYMPLIIQLLQERGLDVYQAETDLPTPVLAYATKYFSQLGFEHSECAGGILLTASHNPWNYGGYNFLTPDGAIVPSHISKQFEELQKLPLEKRLDREQFGLPAIPTHKTFDPYPIYQRHLKEVIGIDYAAIRESGLKIFYDPLFATGRVYFPRLLQDEGIAVTAIHDTAERPAGYVGYPEPSASNLKELAELLQASEGPLKVGFSNDGDADRFGILDETGQYLSPNEVLCLVLYHLEKNKKQQGVVARSQATTHLLDLLADQAGLEVEQTPVGYKYIAEEFIERQEAGHTPVLLGGESSGGLSVLNHLPEKDGLLANLLVADLIATERKNLSKILSQLKNSVPKRFAFSEWSVHTDKGSDISQLLLDWVEQGKAVDGLNIDKQKTRQAAETLEAKYGTRDGVKIYLEEGSWVLQRLSGTEPLLRLYVETQDASEQAAREKLEGVLQVMRELFTGHFQIPTGQITVKA